MLRDAGYAPVAEDAGGVVLAQRPDQPRALARTRPRVPPRELPAQLRSDQLDQVIAALRRGERAARAANRAPNPDVRSTADAITVLREAIATRQRIWVGYVDAHGGNVSRLVRPVSIGAGYLRAADDRTETLHTFSLHRIVSATPAEV
jgi:predicted DNA-binding transcriptional regulator YafY